MYLRLAEPPHGSENPAGVYPDVGVNPAPRGSMPGSGAPDHHGDVRGIFGNVCLTLYSFFAIDSRVIPEYHTLSAPGLQRYLWSPFISLFRSYQLHST